MSDEPKKVWTRTTDPELAAMARIDKLLAGMEPTAAARVLGWLSAKYTWQTPPPAWDASYRRGEGKPCE